MIANLGMNPGNGRGKATVEGEVELSQSVEPGGTPRLSPSAFNSFIEQVYPCSGLLSSGLVSSLLYKVHPEKEQAQYAGNRDT